MLRHSAGTHIRPHIRPTVLLQENRAPDNHSVQFIANENKMKCAGARLFLSLTVTTVVRYKSTHFLEWADSCGIYS